MNADLIIDFEHHLKHGKVYLVEVQMPLQDAPDDVPSSINVDVYITANSFYQAQYIANTMYPDSELSVYQQPITEKDYATRRNRSLL